ncbi:MAG: efflux RND transporter periplasmic adaptor subunit [Gammaproteobacteria bacterium]|nr:efflux RND transporter periplasmic adaptor subunit [Gammaproteobacteria bacterium]
MSEASQPSYTKTRILLILLIAIIIILVLRAVSGVFFHKKQVEPPISVAVAIVKTQNVPVYFSAIGTVNADQTITIKTQINGILTHVYFHDGQMIKAGDVLAEIDPRPYEAQVLQYQGQLTRDESLLVNAKLDLKRYINLYLSRAVSQQTLDTQKSLVKQDEGSVNIDKGLLIAAKVKLEYCDIISPVSGRIGLSVVDEGNFVQTSDTNGIAVITTLAPIQVYFPLPQNDLPAITKRFSAGKKLEVDVYNRDKSQLLTKGFLAAIDSQINTTTGTIKLEGVFENKDIVLFPNQFVNVSLKVTVLKNALIIPTAAVQQGATGPYIYRYNINHTVSSVPIKTSVAYGEDTVITSGLSANQIVVTQGTDKLYEGAKVVAGS